MARIGINTGAAANDGTGDSLRAAGGIINSNFLEIYTYLGAGSTTVLSAPVWSRVSSGIHTSSKVGIGTTNPTSSLTVGGSAVITGVTTLGSSNGIGTVTIGLGTAALYVDGNARVVGILTVGSSSITLNGSTNRINVGTGVTIDGNTGIISATSLFLSGTNITGAAVTNIQAGTGIAVNQNTGQVTISVTGIAGTWVTTSVGIHTLKNVGIGTTNPTSKLTVSGLTSTTNLYVAGVSTFAGITTTQSTLFANQLSVVGVSTLGTTNLTNLTAQQINVSGASTFAQFSITNLNVAGVSTLSGDVTIGGNVSQLNVSGVTTSVGGFIGNLTGTATTATNLTDAANITTGTINSSRLSGTYAINVSGSAGYATTAGIATVAQGLVGTPTITVDAINAVSASFSGNVSIAGTLTYDDVTNVDSLGIVTARTGVLIGSPISIGATLTSSGNARFAGVVTATSFYGDGSNLSNTGAVVSSGSGTQRLVLTDITSGIMTSAATNSQLTFTSSSGTLSATAFVGDGSGLSNTGAAITSSSGSQRLVLTSITSGIMTGAATNSALTYNSSTGTLSATAFAGDGSNLVNVVAAGTGVQVRDDQNVVGTAATIDFGSNLGVTFGSGIATVTGNANYFVKTSAGIHTLSNAGIGTTNPTSKLTVSGDTLITGVVTATTFNGQINASTSTLGNASATNLTSQQLNVSGITTTDSLNIGATQIISSGRQLQNIASLDATTTATIESAIANAPNTFTDLNVTGISTLGIISSTDLTAQQINISGVSTFAGITTVTGNTLFTKQLNVSGVSTLTQLRVSGVSTLGTTNITQLNVSGLSYFNSTIEGKTFTVPTGNSNEGFYLVNGTGGSNVFGLTYNPTESYSLLDSSGDPLRIRGAVNITLTSGVGFSEETLAVFNKNNSVELYYDNGKKFETTTDGAKVIGVLTATSYNGSGSNLTGIVTYITAGSGISIDQNVGQVTITATGGVGVGTQTLDQVLGYGNTSSRGMSVGVITATAFVGDGSQLTGISGGGGSSQWITTSVGIHTLSAVGIGTTNPTSALTVKGNTSLETLNVSGVSTFADTVTINGSAQFNDNKQLNFGTNTNATLSYNTATSSLRIFANNTDTNLITDNFNVTSNAKNALKTYKDAQVELYYNNVKKFETLGAGVTVTGTTFTNQLSVSGVSTFSYIQNTGITSTKDLIVYGTGNGAGSISTMALMSRTNYLDFGPAIDNTSAPQSFALRLGSDRAPGTLGAYKVFEANWSSMAGGGAVFLNNWNGNEAIVVNNTGVIAGRFVPVIIGTASSTGTSDQKLQVTGGAYVSGNTGIGITIPQTPLQVERYGVKTGLGTFSASPGTTTDLDSFTISSTDFKTAEYTLHVGYGTYIQAQKVLVMQNGAFAYSQEYAVMYEPSLIVSIGATVSSGVCKLQATPETGISGIVTYRFARETML